MSKDLIQNLIQNPSVGSITETLSLKDESEIQKLFNAANDFKKSEVGDTVYFRGILEISNRCHKDCYYCGIRKSMSINRYIMTQTEVLEMAQFAYENRYGSILLQSGEREDEDFVSYVSDLITEIKKIGGGKL